MNRHLRIQIGRPQGGINKIFCSSPSEIAHLKHTIARLENKIQRMAEDLQYEIDDWQKALKTGERQESIEAIKRRISRLRGAIDYPGVV